MKKIITIFLLFISIYGFACVCVPIFKLTEIQEIEIQNSECIFIGEVIHVDNENFTYTIKVTESLDGGDEEGNIYSGKNWKSCEPFIEKKDKWIVYGHMEEGYLRTNLCGISRSFNHPIVINTLPKLESYKNKSESERMLLFQEAQTKNIKRAKLELELEISALRKRRTSL